MGRGVAAAAAMAHVRSALRAYAAVDPDPTSVLDRVGQMFETYGTEGLVTVTVALATPDAEEVRIASAGHLPPVLRGRDGAVSLVDLPQAPPLGAGNHPHPARTLQFARGSSLLLYSDGLVERRDEDIDTGIGRLLRALADLPARMTDADAADLAARLITPGHDDDVTVLAVQAG
jgi:serine phosphatase RsbU (regulator of sigma subunit)